MKTIEIDSEKTRSILEHLRAEGIFLSAPCGGNGTCGKCKVRFTEQAPMPSQQDRQILSRQELEDGWRLSCQTFTEGPVRIAFWDHSEDDIVAETGFYQEQDKVGKTGFYRGQDEASKTGFFRDKSEKLIVDNMESNRILSVDIGTTTIAASLIDRKKQRCLDTITSLNHQRRYGADVISRIEASNQGKEEEMKRCIEQDLSELCHRFGLGENVYEIGIPLIISANTTMQHILQGLDCRGLGRYPFTPVDLSLHTYKNMQILPGVSAYVGADIVSGIIACDLDQKEEISILLDLGTNGEMVIGNRDKILAASTAAGPALEGGNITYGVAGVPGAIDTVTIEKEVAQITTIQNQAPIGICGSGVIEIVAELLKEEIIDETGCMNEKYFESGFPLADGIRFMIKDVREVQLAKSAIRSGIEILIESYGISYEDIGHVYLAGGFGRKINYHKTVLIGMIPAELEEKIIAVGNSSLAGANLLAMNPDLGERFLHVATMTEEVLLSKHERFDDLYMDHMFFPGR